MESATAVEERLSALEQRLETMEHRLAERSVLPEQSNPPVTRGWRAIVGKFSNDPAYAEAMRLGREWRDAQREPLEDEA